MSHQVLPSDRWPLFELRASILDGGRTRLHFSFDFLVGDAWSLQVLLPRAEPRLTTSARAELPPLAVSFRDYVVAISRLEEWPGYQRALDYWRARLADLPPAPELPLAMSPAALATPHFARHAGRLATADWQRLKERAARGGLTPSGLLLAAFAEVLTVWTKSPRFTINVTLFNRLPLHPEVTQLVGDFTSLTLLAIDNSRPAPFGERAQRVQTQLCDDLDHARSRGIRVLRELARRAGRPGAGHHAGGLHQHPRPRRRRARRWPGWREAELGFVVSQTPQVWLDHQVLEEPPGPPIAGTWSRSCSRPGWSRRCSRPTSGCWSGWPPTRRPGSDAAPCWRRSAELALYAAANATAGPVPDGLLHDPFAARRRPPARGGGDRGDLTLTYGELARRANALARQLRALGAAADCLVAVVMEKGWEQSSACSRILPRRGLPAGRPGPARGPPQLPARERRRRDRPHPAPCSRRARVAGRGAPPRIPRPAPDEDGGPLPAGRFPAGRRTSPT